MILTEEIGEIRQQQQQQQQQQLNTKQVQTCHLF